MFKCGLSEVMQLSDVVLFLHSVSDKKCRSMLIFCTMCCGQKIIAVVFGLVCTFSLTLFSFSNRATRIKTGSESTGVDLGGSKSQTSLWGLGDLGFQSGQRHGSVRKP